METKQKMPREQFIDYVHHGGKSACSPQIGGAAGFDTRLAGKCWISDTTIEDTLQAIERFDILRLVNTGCPYDRLLGDQGWTVSQMTNTPERRSWEETLQTPVGRLTRMIVENIENCPLSLQYPIHSNQDLQPAEYYVDALIDGDDASLVQSIRSIRDQIGERAALSLQWGMQPYEMFCLPSTVDTVMLAYDEPVWFQRMLEKMLVLDEKLISAAAKGGADFVMLGGPGSEIISPRYFTDYIIPYGSIVSQMVHKHGLLVYTHMCSRIEPFLSMGCYNQLGIDLFETLSESPVGNVKSLDDAFDKLDPAMCTRGNVSLTTLLQGTTEDVRREADVIVETAQRRGRKHMLSASDYLYYHVPERNVQALVNAVTQG